MKKIINFCFLLLYTNLYSANNEVQKKDKANTKESLTLKERSSNNENDFLSVNRGFTYSTGTGIGTGFF